MPYLKGIDMRNQECILQLASVTLFILDQHHF